MSFNPEKLINIRKSLGISKAEAARRLNMSAMGYGRYESGERTPSYQTISYMAQVLGTSADYLMDKDNNPSADYIVISKDSTIYPLVEVMQTADKSTAELVLEFYNSLIENK